MARKKSARRKSAAGTSAKTARGRGESGAGAGPVGGARRARADLHAPASVAIERMPEPARTIARAADAVIRAAAPGCSGVVKWGNACYYLPAEAGEKPVGFAAIYSTKSGVNLALPGAGLPDPEGLLEGTGKRMRHVKLRDAALARSPAVRALITAGMKVGFTRM